MKKPAKRLLTDLKSYYEKIIDAHNTFKSIICLILNDRIRLSYKLSNHMLVVIFVRRMIGRFSYD